MKIGIINDVPFFLGFGGKEIQIQAYAKFCQQNGIHYEFLSPWDREAIEQINVIHIFGSSKTVHNHIILLKNKYPEKHIFLSPNFYSYTPILEYFFSRLLRKFYIPTIFKYRFEMFQKADTLIVNSESEKRQLSSIYSINPGKINILKNGIEKDFPILSINKNNLFTSKFGIKPGYILSVGFLDERKNSIGLIKAFKNILTRTNLTLVLIGGFRFTKEINTKKAIDLINSTDNIVHIPFINRNTEIELLKSAYKNCSIHILPSFIETPGISTIEAMSYKKTCVVGNCKPVRDYFGDSVIYCDPNSTISIEKAILNSIEIEKSSSFKNESFNKYNWEMLLVELPKLYQKTN